MYTYIGEYMEYNKELHLSENIAALYGKLSANQQSALTKQAKEALGIVGRASGEDEQRRVFDWLAANKPVIDKPSDSTVAPEVISPSAPEATTNNDAIQQAISAGIAEGVRQALEALAIQKKPVVSYTAIRVQDELIPAVKALKELYRKGATAAEIIKAIENIKAG